MPSNPIRVAHVVLGLEPEIGGPAYSVPSLCNALDGLGVNVQLFTVAKAETATSVQDTGGVRLTRCRWDLHDVPVVGPYRCSRALANVLARTLPGVDICHVHGLWNWPSVVAARAAEKAGVPLIVAPRGMLSPGALRISAWKKKLFWPLIQWPAMRQLACFHVTSALEADEIQSFCREHDFQVPIAILPNGIDVDDALPPRCPAERRTILALGRIHPKKGLDVLVRAWSRIAAARPDWCVRIVGPSEGNHSDELLALAARLKTPRLSIEGPCFGSAKKDAYRNADVFVLPSHGENFGLTIAEALSYEVPVIATKSTPWSVLAEKECGWWIDEGDVALVGALETATCLSAEARSAMGGRGRSYVQRTFQWRAIATDMLACYEWMLNRGPTPSVVQASNKGVI